MTMFWSLIDFLADRQVAITFGLQVLAGALVGLLIYYLFTPTQPAPVPEDDDPLIFGGSALDVERETRIYAAMQQPKVRSFDKANFQASHTATVVDLASRQRGIQ